MAARQRMQASPWVQVLLAPWRRSGQRHPALALGLPLLAMLLVPPALRLAGASRIAGVLAPLLLVLALLVLWCSFVSGLLRQNLPAAARLVPGQLWHLRSVLLLGWLVLVAGQVLLGSWWFGKGLLWHLVVAWLLLGAAWVVRWPVMWAVAWVLPSLSWWWGDWPLVRAATAWVLRAADEQPLSLVLATVLTAGLCLPGLLQGGGSAHQRSRALRETWSQRLAGVGAGTGAAGSWDAQASWPRRLVRMFSLPYRWWLAHISQPRHAVMARAVLALGPSAHWTQQLTVALVLAAIALGVLVTLVLQGVLPAQGFKRSHLLGAGIGLLSFALSPLWQLSSAMRATRREQALLMLLPGMPRGAAFNHALLLRLALPLLSAWAAAAAFALWMLGDTPGSGPVMHALVWGSLPLVLLLSRDWSCMPPPHGGWVGLVVLCVVLGLMGLVALTRALDIPPLCLAAVSLAITTGLALWRWRVLGRAPAAWPAARRTPRAGLHGLRPSRVSPGA